MPDDIPPAPSESADDASKAETIRISLPAKPEQPTAKRETVRINLPGKPVPTAPLPPGVGPKKETTKILGAPDAAVAETQVAPAIPPPPTSAAKPFVPPPPKPPSSLGAAPV